MKSAIRLVRHVGGGGHALLASVPLVLLGCAGGGGEIDATGDSPVASAVLASVDLGDGHRVEVEQFTTGHVMLVARWQADRPPMDAETLARFDPHVTSFVQLYEDLSARAPGHAPASPATLASLRTIDEKLASLPKEAPPDGVGTATSALHRWGDYNTSPGDFNWFSSNFCAYADVCEVGLLSPNSVTQRSHNAVSTLFNEDATADDAYLRLSWDPCSNASGFCTKPFQTLQSISVSHRMVVRTNTWFTQANDGVVWGDSAGGSHYGWALVFD